MVHVAFSNFNHTGVLIANQPAGYAFQAVDQRRNGYFWGIDDKQMNMIVFPVKFNKFRLKITANTGKYFLKIVKDGLCKDATAILCDKDQMDMKKKNTVSSSTYAVDFFHRATII